MKAVAVSDPRVHDVPGGRGLLVKVLGVGVDGTDKEINAAFFDVNFSNVFKLFDRSGRLLDTAFLRRTQEFLNELIWMATTWRYGREHVPLPVSQG